MSFSYARTLVSGSVISDLEGDKLILPPFVLEELLRTASQSVPGDFSDAQLPYPITFQITNPKTRLVTHGGVLEFNAKDEKAYLPKWMHDSLSLTNGSEVTIRLKELPKGTWARFRPMNADYKEIPDYRAAFEGYLRSHYTTLTAGEILTIKQADSSYQFLVESLKPSNAVRIVDTDLELEIEPLDAGHNAFKTFKGDTENDIQVEKTVNGKVSKNIYAYWNVLGIERLHGLNIELRILSGDADLIVSTVRNPTVDAHLWSNFETASKKNIFIPATNSEYATSNELAIGVHGFSDEPASYELEITSSDQSSKSNNSEITITNVVNENSPGYAKCDNCGSWIPERTIALHSNFCQRNNIKCNLCGKVMLKGEEQKHWHCTYCNKFGDYLEKEKHILIFHTSRPCSCGFEAESLPGLAQHKRTTCPEKLITCRFCYNLVKQGSPSTNQHDLLEGLTAHESYCGGRTTTCVKCHQPVVLKNIATHNMMHEIEKQNRKLPPLCRNKNCVRIAADNVLKLCATCFGPFWSPTADPEKKMLYTRVARKYHSQLTTGCGQSWCKNLHCATGNSSPQDPTTAALSLTPLLKQLQLSTTAFMYLCVDEQTTKKRTLANILYKGEDGGGFEGEYADEFCVYAIEVENGDLSAARKWLIDNAPKVKWVP
ncbi:UFD1-domain-containing protein [Gigaspora margarita]|uniref:UFD1-domain-containing protein n=1 Tax=Gigaspora margarita TaxID=4874 RepID=A0A8H3XCG3_GIGMA|nr:UFD1-domain-containing protein [Gigaspora margarita]